MPDIPRRGVLMSAAAAGVSAQLPRTAAAAPAQPPPPDSAAGGGPDPVRVRWLEDGGLGAAPGSTFGVPWPRGQVRAGQDFSLVADDGTQVAAQTWPTAYWPDGTLKWTAHAVGPAASGAGTLTLRPGAPAEPARAVRVTGGHGTVTVDTGALTARIGTRGRALVRSLRRGGTEVARDGHLVLLRQSEPAEGDTGSTKWHRFTSRIEKATVEQRGPVRAVVRVEGKHGGGKDGGGKDGNGGRAWLPFSVRLYFYAGSEAVRMVHTLTYDGDAGKDFIRGLGVRFTVPLRDETYDRHIRLGGEGDGMLTEAVKGVTGLRRDPGQAIRTAQVKGAKLPDPASWDERVTKRLDLIPTWGDYTLSQLSADGFTVRKRTGPGRGWIAAGGGRRAAGFGYLGGAGGGLSFGLRDFWRRFPAGLDIRGAARDEAEATVWLWSPEAQPMDLRFYHDGLGQDSYEKQLEGLEITYEDYEPEFGTPYGIARTSELMFWANEATPSAGELARQAAAVRTPPQLAAPPEQLAGAKVLGGLFAPADRSGAGRTKLEDHLDFLFGYYRDQADQRRWYGFWDHGDVMHSYDEDRHQWRYDVGGYAWDNSELSPDLWLWYAYLRSGRADVFRFAEAMTRHTGEVDVYHLGEWAGLGTRHGVQHFADSAKQQRISTAVYRRPYYFLTADERTGDLMRALVDSDETFLVLDPLRKVRDDVYEPDRNALSVGMGTDWSGIAAAWLTEWERGGPRAERAERRLRTTMRTIAALPKGFWTKGVRYDLDTAEFSAENPDAVEVSHLSAVFGQVEVCAELIHLTGDEDFERAWLQYCRLYGAGGAAMERELGEDLSRSAVLQQGHSRLTAYAAARTGDAGMARRAWREFYTKDPWGYTESSPWRTEKLDGPQALVPGEEAAWVDTNTTAQYALAAIQNLALIGDHLPGPG
ncbi:Tat pathway signal sequence domain protein, partial [Streptomyces boncukensis]